jgi:hypothetical protein
MSEAVKRTRRQESAVRSRAFHAGRIAAAATPGARAQLAFDRIKALAADADGQKSAHIFSRAESALMLIADLLDEVPS